ncbi:putative PurR-regulated permease PerM [Nocardia kruczakiae]|uniref:PurR-regulated permease PerM n=1 Tax=Nocardia kruczakiae TaxID=261477 RepID=A0ABU1XA77_9NOCA|nr:SHOCT domain-containing protein [Nocardia kruczakiae]MDR7167453.1 putative PurR-regulated permease PerM [Nocardia kruczakiae]
MSVWDVFWLIIMSFAFAAYLMLLFWIFTDLFRDHGTSGWVKAIWVVFLFVLPLLTSLVYLIVRGGGMARRSAQAAKQVEQAQDAYIKEVVGTSSAAQIADAKRLLDEGTITAEEFDRLKTRALA